MSLKFENSLIYKVQQSNDIVEVISEHLRLDRKGKEFVGLCPFHEDHKPSMFVNPDKGIFKCFACGVGGDVIKFVQMRENLSFPQSVESLAKRAGIQIKPLARRDNDKKFEIDPKRLEQINLFAAKFFRDNLNQQGVGEHALKYLQDRQISPGSIKSWGLGLAVDSWDNLKNKAEASGINEKQLVDAGLAVNRPTGKGSYDKFRNRLMFPIIDSTNKVIGFGGRTLGDDPAKYMNSPATPLFDKSRCLYGLNHARHEIVKSSTAVVVEGYTDVIMAHQNGCKNVVATLGTSLTDGHARVLRRFAKRIVLLFDNDVAGSEAANRALEVCLKQKVDIKIAFVAEGKDPCDFILANGGEAFNGIVENAVDVMEYKWQRTKDILNQSDSLADNRSVIEDYMNSIASAIRSGNVDLITIGQIVSRLKKITGLDEDQLRKYLNVKASASLANRNSYVQTVENESVKVRNLGPSYIFKAQRHILEVLLSNPGLYEGYSQILTEDLFDDPDLKSVMGILQRLLGETTGRNIVQKVTAEIEDPKLAGIVIKLEEKGEKYDNKKEVLEQSIQAIQKYKSQSNSLTSQSMRDEDLKKIMENASKPDMRKTGIVF